MPRDSFVHAATTTASRPDVWAALQEPQTWEGIGGVDRVYNPVVDSDGQLRGFDFDTVVAGKPYVGKATPHNREEGRTMAWNIENSEIRGITQIELSDHQGGTEVTVSLEVESKGLLSTIFFGAITKTIGSGLPRTVEEFARSLGPC
ncbi:MAG: hypothetical protein U9N56_07155 [Actinomycetota bacterium]|nr:hypothetical protein [Actinomycetota bacterium]